MFVRCREAWLAGRLWEGLDGSSSELDDASWGGEGELKTRQTSQTGQTCMYVLSILLAVSCRVLETERSMREKAAGLRSKSEVTTVWLSRRMSPLFGSEVACSSFETACRVSREEGGVA